MRSTKLSIAILLAAIVGFAGTIETRHNTSDNEGFGTKISAAACDGDTWTGWIGRGTVDDVTFDITLTEDGDAGGGVVMAMRCETSNSKRTANDAGFDKCSQSTSTGVSTYTCPNVWNLTIVAAQQWSWTASNINHKYINCLFDCGADAGDTITVYAQGISP